ncbi:MAG: HNH endonuclease signature motif containing protein [Duganella sp.]
MEFYWVNIGATHKTVIDQHFLWAPKSSVNKVGNEVTRLFWDNVGKVRQGDIIFCCYDQRISFLAIADGDSYTEERPIARSFGEWDAIGNRVDVQIVELDRRVHRDEISSEFIARFNNRSVPSLFSNQATLNQIYMAHLPADAGMFLLEAVNQTARCEEAFISSGSSEPAKISATTREALVMARVGQGRFRADLIKRWGGKCALTGLQNVNLMVASHINSWALSNNVERLDVDNGLLLAPHIDRLFDQGLISFSGDGMLQISPNLSGDDRLIFGLDKFTRIMTLSGGNLSYLERHRKRFNFL